MMILGSAALKPVIAPEALRCQLRVVSFLTHMLEVTFKLVEVGQMHLSFT